MFFVNSKCQLHKVPRILYVKEYIVLKAVQITLKGTEVFQSSFFCLYEFPESAH